MEELVCGKAARSSAKLLHVIPSKDLARREEESSTIRIRRSCEMSGRGKEKCAGDSEKCQEFS